MRSSAMLLRKTEREPPHARAPICSYLMKRAILTRGSPTVLLIAASERSSIENPEKFHAFISRVA
jgi:hypothetical protein